eukprot:TRINITY_DN21143_c0_g1_i1.p4 TRINITY_DN21143_c0_g1~~TRINITY_DN21143_c0_g1_i1.p4  ORF type:complete len:126 (+),score=78.28 TRINITY_DN21143_c0_g1_i1:58-435(+)
MAKSLRAKCKKVAKRELNKRVKPLIDHRVAQLSAKVTGADVDMTPKQFHFAPHKKHVVKKVEEAEAMDTEGAVATGTKLPSTTTGKSKASRAVVGKIVKTSQKQKEAKGKRIKVNITAAKKKIIV